MSDIATRVTMIPDLQIGKFFGVTDIKNVRDLSSKQLKAQFAAAQTAGLPFNLIGSTRTQHISRTLRQAIEQTKGKIGEAAIFIDERADDRQQQAIATLLSGDVGGPWATLAWTWPTVHGPKRVPYEIELNGIASRVRAGDSLDVESATIRNPVTGVETHPAVLLPEGIIVKRDDLGCSKAFRLSDAMSMDHSAGQ